MSIADKIENAAEDVKGKVKEWVGDKTDNESMQAEGIADQAGAHVSQAGEHLSDAGHDAKDAFTDAKDAVTGREPERTGYNQV
ncbi:uncharacterized protein YjbJ (UPF0337 family) [Allocatelliglobosispora scoriae]|uniref:Uncharacterized protein YjbJ (UPF0337 family) n=1 Tax=Allocatelliglobosispora scoriae TaxID=643052 RepID=A0A841BMH2_9ACTN|nr:CsbD family protein [Allocatelliglobosispora scoriae]MBB5868865.1 uncharacterized protein YjbJ (UPF0337 family) [Allocatelliglobosispora scoriae]